VQSLEGHAVSVPNGLARIHVAQIQRA
jgi:hypothetical protein